MEPVPDPSDRLSGEAGHGCYRHVQSVDLPAHHADLHFQRHFFPVSNLPTWAQPMALAFPRNHNGGAGPAVRLGGSQTHPAICIAYLLLFAVMFLLLAMRTMRKCLIN